MIDDSGKEKQGQQMQPLFLALIYLMFFLSGGAALLYEVVWVRSLSLIFGGTHLAVTTVLSVFMGGLALGSHLIGKRVDVEKNPLRLYGLLELGIAASAVLFIILMKVYPSIYVVLAEGKDNSRLYLSLVRAVFSTLALLIPTTLMGGTLPVLSRFVSGSHEKIGSHLSFLYGFNTLGAVLGAAAAGFYLLPEYSVSTALHVAIATNVIIGAAGVFLSGRMPAVTPALPAAEGSGATAGTPTGETTHLLSARLVLWGIGVSGFCALGYEVLWTRILTLTVGTSVYGFTIMLVAFLTGIAVGSSAYGLLLKLLPSRGRGTASRILGFGVVEMIIGIAALFVTIHIRDLPAHSMFLRDFFASEVKSHFDARQLANITIAFSFMFVPAFFMGVAFPLAGEVTAAYRRRIGAAVGGILSYNTVGAILGSAVSGFVMLYALGLERSLQILTVVNVGLGLLVVFSLMNRRLITGAVGCLTASCIVFLAVNQNAFKVWNMKYFAIFRNNQPDAFDTPEKRRDALRNTDVLFYLEGVNSTVSVIKVKGADQALLVNGKVVASSTLDDRQCQLTLGHLPMLLHKDPKKVLVVGLGTGMTLGAVSVHPELESLTLAEIEPKVLPAARTFGKYNHNVLDNPKLHIVFNDGRNFLLTTKSRYDVITADPIHPWTQGSGYLYTSEYFKLASEHLRPGGIMCQWLPIYEMSVADLRSVVRTFSLHFKYTMTWLTQYDAEIIGSNSPIIIDEGALEKRISFPAVREDLQKVMMGTAEDFLSYFVMGTAGMQRFGRDGIINTDDNLYLEFSTPASMGRNVMGRNVMALGQDRESIVPYLLLPHEAKAHEELVRQWEQNRTAAMVEDRAHALFLAGARETAEFAALMAELDRRYPEFAPGKYLEMRYRFDLSMMPSLLRQVRLTFLTAEGEKTVVELSAVRAPAGKRRGAVMFVDNAARKIYGQKYFSGDGYVEKMDKFSADVIAAIRAVYAAEAGKARALGREFPAMESTLPMIGDAIKREISRAKNSNDSHQNLAR
jgi:spermidine synthase